MEKLPPHDIDAEEAVIGSCLINPDAFVQAAPILNVGDFYSERNSFCWQAMKQLSDRHDRIDTITVANELSNMGKIEAIGGAAYLQHLIAIVPTSLDAEQHARIVARCSQARKLIDCAGKIAQMAYNAGADISTALKKAQEMITTMTGESIKPLVYTPRDIADFAMERYSQLQTKGDETAISYGFHELDELTGGAHKGDLILLGGRPRMGKSALAQSWANNIAQSHYILYCSLEMTLAQLVDRDIVAAVKQPIQVISRGKYDFDTECQIISFLGPLSERKLYLLRREGGSVTTTDIRAALARLKLDVDIDVVFVDYLGLLADRYGNTENDRIGYISRSLKNIAHSFDVALIAISQLSRAVEKERFNKRPRLSDLRDSGSLEQDCDVAMFLYRDDVYYTEDEWNEEMNKNGKKWKPKTEQKPYPRGIAELMVEKQRQRESGRFIKLNWNGKLMQFSDYKPSEEGEPQLPLED